MGTPNDPWMGTATPIPASQPATPVSVAIYSPVDGSFHALPNVDCLSVSQRIGADPGRARIRYRFDGKDSNGPQSMEQALGTGYSFADLVSVGQRVVVAATRPDGVSEYLFDGFPLGFGLDFSPSTEQVAIDCGGVARVLWDAPVGGAIMRNGLHPSTVSDYQTDLVAQFNPRGIPNCTPDGANAGSTAAYQDYPTFLDPLIARTPAPQTYWTLPKAARYLMFSNLAANTTGGSQAVQLPTGPSLDRTLVSREPIAGVPYDPANTATYTAKPINLADRPITGRGFPDELEDAVRGFGFSTWFALSKVGATGVPVTTLNVNALQSGPLKPLYLQAYGEILDGNLSNTNQASVRRDISEAINSWQVVGGLRQFETSWVLYPLFPSNAADAGSAASIAAFDESAAGFDQNTYRTYVVDETGDGCYAPGSAAIINAVPDLRSILGSDPGGGKGYVDRRRQPIGDLITTDPVGKPLRWRVSISTNSTQGPGPWDGSGDWQPVDGGCELLKDRLGVRITEANPNAWNIGKSSVAGAPFPRGVVKAVKCMASPDAVNPAFRLRLTCVIEGDTALQFTSSRSANSAIPNTVTRSIDARDRALQQQRAAYSEFNPTPFAQIIRTDNDIVTAEAISATQASETGVLDGQFVIPYVTNFYKLGDRIQTILGRNLGLRTDNPSASNPNAAVYPVVIGIDWLLDGEQKTVLHVSDQSAFRRTYERYVYRNGGSEG